MISQNNILLQTAQETITLAHAIASFLDTELLACSPQTRKWYRARLRLFSNQLGPDKVLETVTEIDLIAWWRSLEERVEHRNGLQRTPMPAGIGNCVFLNDIRPDEIQSAVNMLENWMVVNNDEIHERR